MVNLCQKVAYPVFILYYLPAHYKSMTYFALKILCKVLKLTTRTTTNELPVYGRRERLDENQVFNKLLFAIPYAFVY